MITDFEILDRVLSAIMRHEDAAILHREHDVAAHSVRSDVDLCVGSDPLRVVSRVHSDIVHSGAFLILVFHYDVSAYSFFFANRLGTGGAQIDLLYDKRGTARYGIRTDAILAHAATGTRWPRITELDEALYVLRKRQVKRDLERIDSALGAVMTFGRARALRRADDILGPKALAAVRCALNGRNCRVAPRAAVFRSRLMRPSRVHRRCGFLAHISSESASGTAQELAPRMNRLIASTAVADPSVSFLLRNLWRPRLVLSIGNPPIWPRADAVLTPSTSAAGHDLRPELIDQMHRRVLDTYRIGHQLSPA